VPLLFLKSDTDLYTTMTDVLQTAISDDLADSSNDSDLVILSPLPKYSNPTTFFPGEEWESVDELAKRKALEDVEKWCEKQKLEKNSRLNLSNVAMCQPPKTHPPSNAVSVRVIKNDGVSEICRTMV